MNKGWFAGLECNGSGLKEEGMVRQMTSWGFCSFRVEGQAVNDQIPTALTNPDKCRLMQGQLEAHPWEPDLHGTIQRGHWGFDERNKRQMKISPEGGYDPRQTQSMEIGLKEMEDFFSIFIKTISGKSVCIQIWESSTIQEVRTIFQSKECMAQEETIFYLEGKILKDTDLISNLNIGRNSNLNITYRLRGGVAGKGATSYSKPSFREVVNNRIAPTQTTEPKPAEYIMEQSTQPLCVEMVTPIIKELYEAYSKRAIICRFNGFWPKTEQLHQWIHQNWSTSIEVSLCAKGFFVVYFQKLEDYRLVNENGP